ncbi:hypothetical protein [Pullulanibacillus pueri]|uniref:hypothetical protein n=1 Tax=Pullulanibacillus pueri TaxID=1437324 RepID=UPI001668B6FC|nr:hypothetical protein [Pullulanibacillus pueri]
MQEHDAHSMTASQWIIDVRHCRGGSDHVYYPLINHLLPLDIEIENDGTQHLVRWLY